ncbi:hypothetical protein GH714_042580 [Hevea brasiliensis]|uniref:tRNA-5-taurinomethyluridine 2-sulfurtransferase n=1 Tax=Hevea brasiliensis TaxID=3981 RepID=A0A6A6K114_HEVBR|nr:hypothetical protein GH714_042580 [Hevea brasiliensis]
MQLHSSLPASGAKSCCGSVDIYDAKRVASALGFPHYVLDYEEVFRKEVIDDFISSYKRGETPIPCVKCNQTVKFRDMLKAARTIGGDVVATGHYVRRVEIAGEQQILRGNLVKSDVRQLAQKLNLGVADKPDSQDICFVPENSYREVLRNLDPASVKKGKIVHVDGRLLGEHDGISNFTVGQRRGLNISAPYPLYVVRLDAEQNIVVVGPQSALMKRALFVKNLNWLPDYDIPEKGLVVDARLRSSGATTRATITSDGEGYGTVVLEEDCVVSPGQACVLYDKERLLGADGYTTSCATKGCSKPGSRRGPQVVVLRPVGCCT